jgi:hypothetical protein
MQRRTPKNYDGTGVTTHRMSDMLAKVLRGFDQKFHDGGEKILLAWPEVIGTRLAPMTQAVSFVDGVLLVKVKNSTLHSLLSQNDKMKILSNLRQKFPQYSIRNIVFRIG